MLIDLGNNISINPANLLYIMRGPDALLFRMVNGRAHKVEATISFSDWMKRMSNHIDLLRYTDCFAVNVDHIVGIQVNTRGVALHLVQDQSTLYHTDMENRHKLYADYVIEINRLFNS